MISFVLLSFTGHSVIVARWWNENAPDEILFPILISVLFIYCCAITFACFAPLHTYIFEKSSGLLMATAVGSASGLTSGSPKANVTRPKMTAAKLYSLRVFTPPKPPEHPPNLDYVSAKRYVRRMRSFSSVSTPRHRWIFLLQPHAKSLGFVALCQPQVFALRWSGRKGQA